MFLCFLLLGGMFVIDTVQCYVLTENQIKEDIKYLSQTIDGIKPSRLRTLLLADLKRALPKPLEVDYTVDADLKVTPNCTCSNYSCARSINQSKRSRIQRSCEDYCCRRSAIVKKSLTAEESNWKKLNDCEIILPENPDSFSIGGIVQIYQPKIKYSTCLGSLIHPKIVITTLECAKIQSTKRLQVKIREIIDKYQYQYQIRNVTKRILPENHIELNGKFGFNIALLVLNKEIHLNNQIRTTCLAQKTDLFNSTPKCFAVSLEYKNGRMLEHKEAVNIKNMQICEAAILNESIQKIGSLKGNICTQQDQLHQQDILRITTNGAPLACVYKDSSGKYHYAQQGMLSWSGSSFNSPYLFTNISNFNNWIDKNMKSLNF